RCIRQGRARHSSFHLAGGAVHPVRAGRAVYSVRSMAVTPEFTPEEAQALLTCVRDYIAILLERGRLGDQMLSSAASRLYSAMLEAGVTPQKLQ
ncbi:MAG: hypothetical protein ACRDPA_03440, partial [Solirubrobacteraceae bacterium]